MPLHLTNAPTAIMDHINRVSDPIWINCDVAYTWHVDIHQGHWRTHYLVEHSVIDNERASIIWQFKEVWVLTWTSSILGT